MNQGVSKNLKEMTDILDIEGIFMSSTAFYIKAVLLVLLGVLVLGLLFYILKKIINKIKNKDSLLSPSERALKRLSKLKKMKLLSQGKGHQFYFMLDELFKRYLYEMFKLDVLDKTYEQIKSDLQIFAGLFLENEMQTFIKYLDRGQLIKFAKMPVDDEMARVDYRFVKDFIIRTKTKVKT